MNSTVLRNHIKIVNYNNVYDVYISLQVIVTIDYIYSKNKLHITKICDKVV